MGTIRLVWPPGEIGSNARLHYMAKARLVKKHREWARLATMAALPIAFPATGKIPVSIVFHPPTARRFDADGLLSRLKAGLDGIADALGVNDNRFRITFEIGDKDPLKAGYVEVTL